MSVGHTSGMIESHSRSRGYWVDIFCLMYTLRPKKQFCIDCVLCDVYVEAVERVEHRHIIINVTKPENTTQMKKALTIQKLLLKEAVEQCVNVMAARRMKGTQLVMKLNRSVWTMQSSPHVYRSSIMIDGNL